MSFEVVCQSCGALSSPSVGVCPFCKSVQLHNGTAAAGSNSLMQIYEKGQLDLALTIAKKIYTDKENPQKDTAFLILYTKILIETEGPTSQINGLLAEALLLEPSNQDVNDYLEIIQAKGNLKKGINDQGEIQLKNIIRRSPNNLHAHFILGTHLFWTDSVPQMAIYYLETCVKLSPKFLRGWGCLAAIYKSLNNPQLNKLALQKCVELETNASMKEYFQKELNQNSN